MKQRNIYLLSWLFFIIVCISCKQTQTNQPPQNTPLPINEEQLLGNWIKYGTNTLNSEWYIYSQVDVDSGAYIVSLKSELSKEESERLSKSYSFKPVNCIWMIQIDTLLNKYKEESYECLDSSRTKHYTYSYSNNQWKHFQPDNLFYSAAPIAEMLYKDKNATQIQKSNIPVHLGNGNWVICKSENDFIKYANDNILETDSSYIIWEYVLFTKMSDRMLLAQNLSNYRSIGQKVGCLQHSIFL